MAPDQKLSNGLCCFQVELTSIATGADLPKKVETCTSISIFKPFPVTLPAPSMSLLHQHWMANDRGWLAAIYFSCGCWYFLHSQCPPVDTSVQYRDPLIFFFCQRPVHIALCRLACANATWQIFLHGSWVCSGTLARGYFQPTVIIRHGIGYLFSAHTSSASWHIFKHILRHSSPLSVELGKFPHEVTVVIWVGRVAVTAESSMVEVDLGCLLLQVMCPSTLLVGSLECIACALWWLVVHPPKIMALWVYIAALL